MLHYSIMVNILLQYSSYCDILFVYAYALTLELQTSAYMHSTGMSTLTMIIIAKVDIPVLDSTTVKTIGT